MEEEVKVIADADKKVKILIPKEIEYLSYRHLKNFRDVEEVVFEEGSKLKEIDDNTFEKTPLRKIDFSNCLNLTSIHNDCFAVCPQLEEIIFAPNTQILELGSCAFWKNDNLINLDFNIFKKIKTINFGCFECCVNLKEADLSQFKNLTVIKNFAFNCCNNLEKVIFPQNNSLKRIGRLAFGDTKIQEIDLSNQIALEEIWEKAFAGSPIKVLNLANCINLKNISIFCFDSFLDKLNLVNVHPDFKFFKLPVDIVETYEKRTVQNLFIAKNLRNNQNDTFGHWFKDGTSVSIIDGENVVARFEISEQSEISKIKLNCVASYLLLKKHNKNPNIDLINALSSEQTAKIYLKNKSKLDKIFENLRANTELDDKTFYSGTINLLQTLGMFGFEGADIEKEFNKNRKIYKNLLARNLAFNTMKGSDLNSLSKIEIGTKIQQLTDKISRDENLEDLIIKFFENNIYNKEFTENLLLEASKFNSNYDLNSVKYAQFFIKNFDDIVEKKLTNMENISMEDNIEETENISVDNKSISLHLIHNTFKNILKTSNKLIITRTNKERLSLNDCEFESRYENIKEGNNLLAKYCGQVHIGQIDFETLQEWFEKGKKIKNEQILLIAKDESAKDITYEFLEKDNPLQLVLGNISNCCQAIGDGGESCIEYGTTRPNSGFIVFKNGDDIIAQSWVWFDEKTKTVAFDNIEVPEKFNKLVNDSKKKEFKDCFNRAVLGFLSKMNKQEIKVENIIVGASATDVKFFEENFYKETDKKKMLQCVKNDIYTDITCEGQYVIVKDGKLITKQELELIKN